MRWRSAATNAVTTLGSGAAGVVLRRVVGVAGSVDLELAYAPRPEYGLVSPALRLVEDGVTARGGADVLALSSPVTLEVDGSTARARFALRSHEALSFALHHRTTSQPPPRPWTQTQIDDRLDDTAEAWRTWSRLHQSYEGPWADLVRTSGRVLYGLTYFPTGAIVAAPTTSLPEVPGGARNWDYRYSWVRDASFTLQALWVAACPHEANKFFDYLANTAAAHVREGADLQIMFGIGGEHDLTERELGHLSGWRGSTPVRIGNGAWNQRQLDVYGELLDAAHRLPEQLDRLGPGTRRFLADLADSGGRPLAGAGPGHLGDPGRAPPLPVQQAHVLGRPRSGDLAGRSLGLARSRRSMDADPRRDRRRHHDPRLERERRQRSPSRSAATNSTPRLS